jgi:hypothetical protein
MAFLRIAYPCACFEIIEEMETSSSLPMSQPWWKRTSAPAKSRERGLLSAWLTSQFVHASVVDE